MRERLISSLKQLPALASRWGAAPTGTPPQPSSFSLNLVKQLRTLSQVAHPALRHLLLPSRGPRHTGLLESHKLAETYLLRCP